MSGGAGMDRERARHLMMAALDGELLEGERAELERLLAAHGDLREEWDRLNRVKEVTGMVSLKRPPEEVWDTYWTSVYNRVERGAGWILASAGVILILSWTAWRVIMELTRDPSVPGVIKLGLLLLAVGGIILFVSVAREKLFTGRNDPYREVER